MRSFLKYQRKLSNYTSQSNIELFKNMASPEWRFIKLQRCSYKPRRRLLALICINHTWRPRTFFNIYLFLQLQLLFSHIQSIYLWYSWSYFLNLTIISTVYSNLHCCITLHADIKLWIMTCWVHFLITLTS